MLVAYILVLKVPKGSNYTLGYLRFLGFIWNPRLAYIDPTDMLLLCTFHSNDLKYNKPVPSCLGEFIS